MKIDSIRTDHYLIPLPTPLYDARHGEMTHFAVVMVKVRCDNGTEGLGYTYTVGKTGGGAIHNMITQDLVPFLTGKDPLHIEEIWEEMWWHFHYIGRGGIVSFAMSAIDIALWDLKARNEEKPLWRLLGGNSKKVKVYAGGIDLHLSIEELQKQTRRNLDNGFRAIKMKVGREQLSEDVERVAAMREFLGPDIPLMVDANMGWSVELAIEASKSFAKYDVYWLEEPTIPEDVEGHVRIAKEGALPIAAGENFRNISEFQRMIACQCLAFPEPDVSNIGGVTAWMKVAKMAEEAGLPVTTHGVHELHVHLLAAVPNASFLEAHGFGLEKFIRQPPVIENGFAIAPERPGHGVEFDRDALEKHRVQ